MVRFRFSFRSTLFCDCAVLGLHVLKAVGTGHNGGLKLLETALWRGFDLEEEYGGLSSGKGIACRG
jgi:hypothetical protein